MLKRIHSEHAESRYASCEDFRRIFEEDLHGLYQLALLLTGDHQKAERCFVAGLEALLFESAQDAARLSHMRYTGGVTGYLEALTNETNSRRSLPSCRPARMNCWRSCSCTKRSEEDGSSEVIKPRDTVNEVIA